MTRGRPGERWYRRLLNLYPRDFRDEFGREMVRLYRDRRREERWWSLWTSLLVDAVRTAPSEHLAILAQDLRHASRALRRTPVITATAVLTLALGIGASTAVFSVVHAVTIRPLPYPDPAALVELFESNPARGVPGMRASALNYLSWAERSRSFDAIAAFGSTGATLTDGLEPEVLSGSLVTASLFDVLRVRPLLGRGLGPEDERPGAPGVVVLSESLWHSRFGSDYGITGRSITLDGQPHQVVGVMPRTFREVGRQQASGAAGAQIFLPMRIDPARENRGNHTLRVVGRLRRGVALEQARDEMRAVSAGLEREFPATNSNWGVRIERLSETTLEPHVRRSLLLALAAVASVFLIACANVANLMLARGARRHPELAVRTALGAGRSRLVRQLLTESGCLAAISGLAGVLMAAMTHPVVRTLLPPSVPRADEIRLDVNVLALGLLVSIASGMAFGVLPALRASRPDVSESLLGLGRATADPSRARLRQLLTVAQIAVATMLLVGAALLLQAFVRLQHVPVGFAPDGVLTARLSLPGSRYSDAERVRQFYERLAGALEASPEIESVAFATSAPFGPGVRASFRPVARNASAAAAADTPGDAAEHIVSRGYFAVLGIPILAGRTFDEHETTGASGAAIVSQRFARLLWPNTNPLGQAFKRSGQRYEVVGVVGDVRGSDTQGARGGSPDREPRAAAYFPARGMPQRTMTLVVRPVGELASAVPLIRRAVHDLDPALAVQHVRPLQDWVAESVAPARLTTTLAVVFAASALLLASVGIYGVLAFTVASRTREIGVRLAIGATRGRVLRLVLRQGMTWAAGGTLAGLAGAFAAANLLAAALFDVQPRDPVTFAAAGAAVMLVALSACLVPAVRAVNIDPTIAMRTE